MTKVALRSGDWIYFFSGNRYIRVHRPGDTGAGILDGGPSPISAWGWGTFGRNGIDAAFRSGTKTYFFSGDQYIRVTRGDTGAGTVDRGYPANISGWGWPDDFRRQWAQIGGNFTFDNRITASQRTTLLERHRFIYSQIQGCNSLTPEQRTALTQAYRRPIRHGIEPVSANVASACIHGNQIFVNFARLAARSADEIAQTLIHEMMHCAGERHPERCDPGAGCWPVDEPGDNGRYFTSPPLNAEKCIVGQQSDASCVRATAERYALSFDPRGGVG